jgi:hypothetical protein
VEFTGDPEGIAALKALYGRDKAYLKFLIGEARSNADFTARFSDGPKKWQIKFDPRTNTLDVKPQGPAQAS